MPFSDREEIRQAREVRSPHSTALRGSAFVRDRSDGCRRRRDRGAARAFRGMRCADRQDNSRFPPQAVRSQASIFPDSDRSRSRRRASAGYSPLKVRRA